MKTDKHLVIRFLIVGDIDESLSSIADYLFQRDDDVFVSSTHRTGEAVFFHRTEEDIKSLKKLVEETGVEILSTEFGTEAQLLWGEE